MHYSDWQSYPWKNELALQLERVLLHGREIADEAFSGAHDPHHMLERAIALAAFCIRRLIEKRLVTDTFAKREFEVSTFAVSAGSAFHMPFHSTSGGNFFSNYDISSPRRIRLKPKNLADEIIHSSQLMVVSAEPTIEDGILIVSDWHLKTRIIHFSFDEFTAFAKAVLDDEIMATTDCRDVGTGKVTATRV